MAKKKEQAFDARALLDETGIVQEKYLVAVQKILDTEQGIDFAEPLSPAVVTILQNRTPRLVGASIVKFPGIAMPSESKKSGLCVKFSEDDAEQQELDRLKAQQRKLSSYLTKDPENEGLQTQLAGVDFCMGHLLLNRNVREVTKALAQIQPNNKGQYTEAQIQELTILNSKLSQIGEERTRQDEIHRQAVETGRIGSLLPSKKIYAQVPTIPNPVDINGLPIMAV